MGFIHVYMGGWLKSFICELAHEDLRCAGTEGADVNGLKMVTVAQIKQLLGVISNEKHLMMISLFYGTGLRMAEMCKLKIEDIDSNNFQVKVVNGKGGKDRFTILPKNLLEPLRNYYKNYRPVVYLFEGQTKGKPMHERSVQHFIEQNIRMIGLGGQDYSGHTFRHSFATHMLQSGVDLHTIKELLGHSSLATTMVYLHLQNSKRSVLSSPFDNLDNPAA